MLTRTITALTFGFALTASAEQPIVVELFTSQGCSSCPPADALIGKMAADPAILPLSFHVDYWNNLGWQDPYSSAANTARQRAYSRLIGGQYGVYTPQAVVDGRFDAVGSDKSELNRALSKARQGQHPMVPVELAVRGGKAEIALGAFESPAKAEIWLVTYDSRHETTVKRGENAGRILVNVNVVRDITSIGHWGGQPLSLTASVHSGDGVAVLVQADDGRILGAKRAEIR